MIGEGSVGVSLEWSFEVMVDGHCWVRSGVVGRFEEEVVAVAVECWGKEEEVRVD